jgi:hypothetical protein
MHNARSIGTSQKEDAFIEHAHGSVHSQVAKTNRISSLHIAYASNHGNAAARAAIAARCMFCSDGSTSCH